MSRPPKPSMRAPLRALAGRDDHARAERLIRALLGPQPQTAEEAVAAYLAEHPDATANQALRELHQRGLKLRRSEGLALVKRLRGTPGSTLQLASPGNRPGTGLASMSVDRRDSA